MLGNGFTACCLLWVAALLSGCERAGPPGAPILVAAVPGQAHVRLSWWPSWVPWASWRSGVATYTAVCKAPGERLTAMSATSPVQVFGLSVGTAYECAVTASNAAGMGEASNAMAVMLEPDASQSLASVYRAAAWAQGMSVTFPSTCVMTLWPAPRPRHAVDDFYLAPTSSAGAGLSPGAANPVVSQTAISRMPLVLRKYEGAGVHEPISVNICPSKAPTTTATNNGVIGVLISGASLYKASEIPGHRATALNDNVMYRFKPSSGQDKAVGFLDACGGHPTPANAGNSYHYHGHSECVTALVDHPVEPSHLIGVALDGFPIYGDRDMQGQKIDPAQLDGCNGITSPTPEFPSGIYHYVLPSGVTQHHAAMRCYAGHVPVKLWAAAEAAGFCYSPDQARSPGAMAMPQSLGRQLQKR